MVTAYPPAVQPVSSPVEVRFGSTQRQRRVTVLFRLILVLPQVIVLYFLLLAAYVITIIGWFAALFTGRLPESFATFLQGVLRWDVRVVSYAFLLDDRYPPFSLDSDPDYPVDLTVSTGKLNRAAVLFRLILVIPASIVAAVFGWGLGGIAVVVWAITLIIGRLPDPIFGATSAYLRYRSRLTAYFCMLTSWYPSAVLGDGTTESGSGTPGAGGPVSGSWGTPPPPPVPAGPIPVPERYRQLRRVRPWSARRVPQTRLRTPRPRLRRPRTLRPRFRWTCLRWQCLPRSVRFLPLAPLPAG